MKRKYQEMFKKIKEGDKESLSYILVTIERNYKSLSDCNYSFSRKVYGKFLKSEKEELLKETLELVQKLNKLKLRHDFVSACLLDNSFHTLRLYIEVDKKIKKVSEYDLNRTSSCNKLIDSDTIIMFSLTDIRKKFLIDDLVDFNKELLGKSNFRDIFIEEDEENILEEEKRVLINASDFHDKTEQYKATKFYSLVLGRELTTVENDLIASIFKKSGLSVEFWDGEIEDLFSERNYSTSFNVGTLSGSCMRYDKCKEWLEFYRHVKDLRGLVIKDREGGVVARALLNKMDNGEYILDRQYGKESITKQMNEWAKKNGYGYIYYTNTYDNEYYYKDGERVKMRNRYLLLDDSIKKREVKEFPYLDNFSQLRCVNNEFRLFSSVTNSRKGYISLKNHQSSYNIYGECDECNKNLGSGDKPNTSPTNILEKGLFMNVHGKGIQILCKKCADKKELYEGEFYNKEDMPKCQKCGKHSFNLKENNGIDICKTCEDSLITCDCGKKVFESDLEFNDETLEFDKCVYCV